MTREGERLSHRGRGLLLLGAVWIMVGLAVFAGTGSNSGFPLDLVPQWVRTVAWCGTGLSAILFAVIGSGAERTKWAFALLLIPASARCASYAISTIVAALGLQVGEASDWIRAVAWALVVAFVIHEASTPVIPPSVLDLGNGEPNGRGNSS